MKHESMREIERKKNQLNKTISERRDITMDTTEIQRIVRDYNEQFVYQLIGQIIRNR